MVDYLKQATGITDGQLRTRIPEDKLWELAGELGNHELYVGVPGFGLNGADKTDLNASAVRNGAQFAMVEAFKKWFDVSVVTYESLVLILLQLRKKAVAESVCKIVVKSGLRPSASASEGNSISNGNVGPSNGVSSETAHVPDVILTMNHKDAIFRILLNAREDHHYIGEGIGVSEADLKEIESTHRPDTKRCLDEILKKRLQQGGLTRSMLCRALRDTIVGRDDMAKKIESLPL